MIPGYQLLYADLSKYRFLISRDINYWPNSGQFDSTRIGAILSFFLSHPPWDPCDFTLVFEKKRCRRTSCHGMQRWRLFGKHTSRALWTPRNIGRFLASRLRLYYRSPTRLTGKLPLRSGPLFFWRRGMCFTLLQGLSTMVTYFLLCVPARHWSFCHFLSLFWACPSPSITSLIFFFWSWHVTHLFDNISI